MKKLIIFILSTLFLCSCTKNKDKGNEEKIISPINGKWEVKALTISGILTTIDSPMNGHEGTCCSDISIEIPNSTQGTINGHTFYNTISFEFEIRDPQQISFKNYGGTRITEDVCGMTFSNHIIHNVVKFEISNNELKFMDSENNPIIIFTKKSM